MEQFPHEYRVTLAATAEGTIGVRAAGLAEIDTAPPVQFGGPGDCWSPETLLVAAVADCFALTFRAMAQASGVPWQSLECEAQGLLTKANGKPSFTGFSLTARLTIATADLETRAMRLLHKAEENCLISNSLVADVTLQPFIEVARP